MNRPGVTVLARNGYFAREAPPVPDRRKYLTENRMAAADRYTGTLNDIRVDAKVSVVPASLSTVPASGRRTTPDGVRTPEAGLRIAEAVIDLTIDITRLSLDDTDGRRVGSLTVALYCGDKNETIVGEIHQTLDLALGEETYERMMKEGLRHTARVPITRAPRYVKAIVYDDGSNAGKHAGDDSGGEEVADRPELTFS